MNKAEIINLKNSIEYQAGAIVSRTLIDKPGGTITLFAFDQDQALSEHTAPFDALVFILDGAVEVNISGESYNLKEGKSIIMPAGEPHSLKAKTNFKMLLIMIKEN